MKTLLNLLIMVLFFSFFGCGNENDNVSHDAAELSVDFSWQGMKPCGKDNPEIDIRRIPVDTKFLNIKMLDIGHHHDNKTVHIPHNGDTKLSRKKYKGITTPCPGMLPGQYRITVKAIGKNGLVIGVGSKERSFPEN